MSYTVAPARFDGVGYTILEDAPLAGRNTFRVAARAALLVDVRNSAALPEVLGFPLVKSSALEVLGEGSNVLLTRDFPGVVLSLMTRGIQVVAETDESAIIRVEAGENWNDLVHWSLAKGYAGLENLALIPGTVGAAPIQNIGAYGSEVCEFVYAVHAYDRQSGIFARLDNEACAFAYRDSCFKREPERWIVTAVELSLPRRHELRLDYAGVREELTAMGVESATPVLVAEAVTRLRRRKLPDPAVIGNAGSFFKNPLLPSPLADALKANHPGVPTWSIDGHQTKLSAAWLIEACGYKGLREGDAGIASQHALVLVNHGQASGAQLWALAQRVRDGVAERFGIMLEPEPRVI